MNKKTKIVLGIVGVLGMATVLGIASGLYLMAVEDHYGNYQDFFFNAKYGDIALNRDTQELRKVEKGWTRVFVVNKGERIDLLTWLDESRIEIYRARPSISGQDPSYSYTDIEQLIKDNKLELIIKNW